MKQTYLPSAFFCFLLIILFFAQSVSAQWDSTGVPCRPFIPTLQVADGIVYAQTGGNRVFASTDQGASWNFVFNARQFAMNPYNQNFYRLSQDATRIEFSTDRGSIWQDFGANPFGSNIFYIRFDFSIDTVYTYANGQIFMNDNGTWNTIPLPQNVSFSTYVVMGNHIYGNQQHMLMHTSDFGLHWDTAAVFSPDIYYFRLAASNNVLLVNYTDLSQNQEIFYRSANLGQSWETYTGPGELWNSGKTAPFILRNRTTQQGFVSTTGQNNWEYVDTWSAPFSMASVNGNWVAGLSFGVQFKQNGVWKSPVFGTGIPNEMSGGDLTMYKSDGYLLLGSEYGYGMSTLADGGSAWERSEQPYFPKDPIKLGNQLVGTGFYGTYQAQASASPFEWQKISDQGGLLFNGDGKLYLYDQKTGFIKRSDDEGFTWFQTGTANVPQAENGLVYLDGKFFAIEGNNLVVSEDEGLSWSVRNSFPGQFSGRMFTLNGKIIVSHAYNQEVYISADSGVTFQLTTAPKNTPYQGVYRLRMRGDVLFLYIGANKFFQSIDEGQSWQKLSGPYPGFNFDLAVAYNSFNVIEGKVYYFDATLGVLWGATLANTLSPPCEAVVINMMPAHCTSEINVTVSNFTPEMVFKWYRNGNLIQQGTNYEPTFIGHQGSKYVLVVSSPAHNCFISDTTIIVPPPLAQIIHPDILSCNLETVELDLSGCSKNPGTEYFMYGWNEAYDYFQYTNQFDAAGNPSNPSTPLVEPGSYFLTVTDPLSGCTATDQAQITRDPNETINEFFLGEASCGAADGVALITNSGNPQINYAWSNGTMDSLATGLAPGWYSVTVTNGFCVERRNFEIVESQDCSVKIRGTVMNDGYNPDCVQEFGTLYVANAMLRLMPDGIYTFTDAIGNYEFTRPPGAYTIELVSQPQYELLCPSSGALSVNLPTYGAVSSGNHFFLKPKQVENLSITVSSGPAVPGFQQKFYASICNFGNEAVSDISVVFSHDAILGDNYPNPYFNQYDPATHTAVYSGLNLQPNQCTNMEFYLQIPVGTPLGTVLQFAIRVLPDDEDGSRGDNIQEWQSTVVGSYDPNDKQVSPGETEFGGKIFERDTMLRYNIRFQNTGTYPATTVEIRDTLDANLDVTSIQLLGSSHSVRMLFEGANVLVFRFENINLPDSTTDYTYSQGFVSFSIKRKAEFVPGIEILNRAAIFFDFNQPVITNEVVSVLSLPVGVRPEPEWMAQLYPNPNNGHFSIQLPEAAPADMVVRLVNSLGQTIQEQVVPEGAIEFPMHAGQVYSGLYVLQFLKADRVLGTTKFFKE